MRKLKAVLAALVLLTGCEKVPPSVPSETESIGSRVLETANSSYSVPASSVNADADSE